MSQALSREHERLELQAKLDKIGRSAGGAFVNGLEAFYQHGKLMIKGKVLNRNAYEQGREASDTTTWLPNGRHRLKPELNLPL